MNRHSPPPPQYRRNQSNSLCSCDCNYARSLQGICKVVQLCILLLAWIIIAASPYWRPIFVMGGQTWPFHIVMFFSIMAWLCTLILYCMFLSGFHLNQGHKNWPRIEFWFNVCMVIVVLIAASLEAANVWRWDMRSGNVMSGGAGSQYSSYYQYGLRPGMSFTQTLNFNSYCSQRPRDCQDYFNLLAGNNSYYTNHLFAVVLLFAALIAYLVSTYFAWRTWRVFERDMYKPGEHLKPTLMMRIQYRFGKARDNVRDKANKVLKRNNEEEENSEVDVDVFVDDSKKKEKSPDVEACFDYDKDTSRSDGRMSRARSHTSHHTSHSHHTSRSHRSSHSSEKPRSHSSENPRSRSSQVAEENGKSPRNSTSRRSKSSSRPISPIAEAPPPYPKDELPLMHSQPVSMLPFNPKKASKKEKKGNDSVTVSMSPVASVMI